MEKEILEILKVMQSDIKAMQLDIKGLKEGQERIENKLEDLKDVEKVTKENCYEIAKIKAIK